MPKLPVRPIPCLLAAVLALLSPALAAQSAQANKSQLRLSDWLRYVPAAGAAGYSMYRDDTDGLWELGKEAAATVLATGVLKASFNSTALGERPDGGDYSFPSGHTSFACSGAAYLGERYGWQPALPAYAVAGWVAYIRVHEDRHYTRDVIAGCALAYGLSKLLVHPFGGAQVSLLPVVEPGSVGLSLQARW